MSDEAKKTPLENSVPLAAESLPIKVMAEATAYQLANFPAPGSMEAVALEKGRRLCLHCRALISTEANYCPNCGTAQKSAAASEAPTPRGPEVQP